MDLSAACIAGVTDVAVIGCGSVGARVAQSLSSVTPEAIGGRLRVHVCDTSPDALTGFSALLENEGGTVHDIQLHGGFDDRFPRHLTLAYIGVTSSHRFGVLTQLLAHCAVDKLLLDKFLFDRREQYDQAEQLIKAAGCSSWVHAARAYWPSYQRVREIAEAWGDAGLNVTGSNYGMACNAVHFLDIIRFVTGNSVTRLEMEGRPLKIFDSKRPGYREFFGTLSGETTTGRAIRLACVGEEGTNVTVRVTGADADIVIEETLRTARLIGKDGTVIEEWEFLPVRASENKAVFVDILTGGNCLLPTYAESKQMHLALFDAMMPHLGTADGALPVT